MPYVWRGAGVTRLLPTPEAVDLLALVEEFAADQLAPRASAAEAAAEFPRASLRALGGLGLLGLPYAPEHGGGGQPAEVCLQALEEIARAWLSVAVSVSVHWLSCFPLANYGSPAQQERWLPDLLDGDLVGGYCLSEPDAGSDAASLTTRAEREGEDYVVTGTKAWITHGGHADSYALMARTSDDGAHGITCLHLPGDAPGLVAAPPEHKMGAMSSPTAQLHLDHVRVPQENRIGAEGAGFPIALAALDAGRLGIAACAVGLAQAALDAAVAYARERRQFDRPIGEFQGITFLLADLATAVTTARAAYVDAARRRDAGVDFGTAAAMAKLAATDAAMRVTTDAIQILGGVGYTTDFPVERYFREAKVLQIVEGTNQIQRLVIGRSLAARR